MLRRKRRESRGRKTRQGDQEKSGKMSSLIDHIGRKEPPVSAPSCRNLDCLYNEDGKCTQGLACKHDETYEKKWFKHA